LLRTKFFAWRNLTLSKRERVHPRPESRNLRRGSLEASTAPVTEGYSHAGSRHFAQILWDRTPILSEVRQDRSPIPRSNHGLENSVSSNFSASVTSVTVMSQCGLPSQSTASFIACCVPCTSL